MHVTDLTVALFPLHSVLFPGGLLSLKVFESRYLDLISACMREKKNFCVVLLNKGQEAGKTETKVSFESIGTLAEIMDVQAHTANILQVKCRGTQRCSVQKRQVAPDGLWQAQVQLLPDDQTVLPTIELVETASALATAITNLKQQGQEPFLKPFHFENAGWVANRWCEILPIPSMAKQHLMALPDPLIRLKLVADFLRGKGVVQ
jgi:uncharacterized protein